MPPRARRPRPTTTPPPSPVEVRNILDLPVELRRQAIAVAGGDATRVRVIGRASYEVTDPAFIPESK